MIKTERDFNPHSREGSDETIKDSHKSAINFNPHSREGSDGALDEKKGKQKDFNPHSREGSDATYISQMFENLFQSTLPRRE